MKTLSNYKAAYKKAKTQKGRQSAMNSAMLNLSHSDQQMFIDFQVDQMNKD
jgi:hypothetical protein